MSSNLPPGVNESMIPGNLPEDMAWEQLHDEIGLEADQEGLTPDEALVAWKMGLAAWKAMKQ